MHVSVKVCPHFGEDGELYLSIFYGSHHEIVGPVEVGKELNAHFINEPEKTGPKPPTKHDRKLSNALEQNIAEMIGGKRQKASGALPHAKGDVRKRGSDRVEHKFTKAKQYVVKLKDLNKIRGEASFGEKPAFVISFVNPTTERVEDRWVLQPIEDWNAQSTDVHPTSQRAK